MAKFNGKPTRDVYGGTNKDDLIYGFGGNDKLSGSNGSDQIYGGIGDDRLNGDFGDDFIFGGKGNDILGGGENSDRLYGEAGNDTFFGGQGDDLMVGGTGADLFHFEVEPWNNPGKDRIKDFTRYTDDIELGTSVSFDDFDSNGDGYLTNADTYVTRNGKETRIDIGAAIGGDSNEKVLSIMAKGYYDLEGFDFDGI